MKGSYSMKKRLIKTGLVIGLAVVILTLGFIMKEVNKRNQEYERELVKEYTTCLKEHWTQRSYCSEQVGRDYRSLDRLIEKYGYSYNQVDYNLYLVGE